MEKELKKLTVTEFLEILAWPDGAPGGGALCALNGALGAAGLILVAKLTAKLKRFEEEAPLCLKIAAQAEPLMKALTDGIDRDVTQYNKIVKACRMPRGTEQERAERKEAIMQATLSATEAPYGVLCQSLQVLQLCQQLNGHYNPAAASDFAAAVLQLNAAAKIAWANILANYPAISNLSRAKAILSLGKEKYGQAMELAGRLNRSAEEILEASIT